jgi:hypothetical protein
MSAPHDPRPQLSVEGLEAREVPATGQWLVEPFQHGPLNGLPSGWSQWSDDNSKVFEVDPNLAGLGDSGRLVSSGSSKTNGRAWLTSSFAADVETSASVFLNSTAPIQLLLRGQNLNTRTPTYYAASVVRGGEVQLLKVVNGQTTILGTVKSTEWVSNKWVTIDIRAVGASLQVRVHRGDENQYLGPDGKWTRQPVAAIEKRDTGIARSGFVGFARAAKSADDVALDSLRIGPSVDTPRTVLFEDRFAGGRRTGLPSGWGQYTTTPGQVDIATETDETLRIDAPSGSITRGWLNRALPADVQISSSIYVDSRIPAGLIARGTSLHTTTPTYYGLNVSRGLEVSLTRVVNGRETVLKTLKSDDYVSGQWIQASLTTKGSELRAQIYRSDTGQYLNADGTWSLTPQWAIVQKDTAITTGERVGLSRGSGTAGELVFDNFIATATPVSLFKANTIPTEKDKSGTPNVRPPEDTSPISPTVPPSPPTVPPSPPTAPSPPTVPSSPPVTPSAGLPKVPRNYQHIRVANLAYFGTPFGDFENSLLRNSVDLVIPNVAYLDQIDEVSPETPQFIYTNVTNIYLGLYTDWLQYADRNRLDRESAFFHVTKETPFIGLSASSVPVNKLWGVYRGDDSGWENITSNARQSDTAFGFADVNKSVALGYPEKYRELNIDLSTAAGSTWAGRYEYVSAVDANGKPTRWSTLTLSSDTTNALRRDGKVSFEPPRDWAPASINGSARLFYTRLLTTRAGTSPQALTVTTEDYTNFRGAAQGGTIPAFDHTADRDNDGYLNAQEWAARRTGFNARFEYQSRLFYPTYGPFRFATNLSNGDFQRWSVDYHQRALRNQPLADGFFVDNSTGKIAINPADVKEPLANYTNDHGALLGRVNSSLGRGKWLIANTAGAGTAGEPIARAGVSTLEEFSLRPLSSNHVQLDDLAARLNYLRQLSGGKAYEILDSLPQGLDASNPRTELATLAMYYLVADPNLSFLMMNGGNEPASGWERHWTDAITFNVGKPTNTLRVIAEGQDPANRSLTYKVYRRDYQNAVVLYKPLSYTRGVNGTIADNTATTHVLDGTYRPVLADGSLGSPVTRVTLRNGEGMILAKVR